MSAKRLGYAPLILDDEPLDGWFEHIAANLFTSVSGLAQHCGLPLKQTPFYFVRDLDQHALNLLSVAADQPPEHLEAATLRRWEKHGLYPDNRPGAASQDPWRRSSGARYCPDCFEQRDGRWKLDWYLQWSFACVDHQRLLLNHCTCGAVPRSRPTWNRTFPERRADACVCTRRLNWPDQTPPLRLPLDHPILRAQRHINAVLHDPATQTTVAGIPTDHATWFKDLTALSKAAVLLAMDKPSDQVASALAQPDDRAQLAECLGNIPPAPQAGRPVPAIKRIAQATNDLRFFAACASTAVDLLDTRDIDDLTTRLEHLPSPYTRIVHSHVHGNRASSALTTAHGGRSSTTRIFDAIRRESSALDPATSALIHPCHVPARAFDTLRTRHTHLLKGELGTAAASAGLLGWPDFRQSLRATVSLLGLERLEREVLAEWARICEADYDQTLLRDIIAVRSLLATQGNPIDYARRRHTYQEPKILADRTVRPVAHELDTPLTKALVLTVSLYVHEQLSGNDALLTERGINLPGAFRMRFRRTRALWTQRPIAAIDAITEAALLRHRIDEPIRWQPTHTEREWTHPEPNYQRTLPGWNDRALRGSSRYRTPGQLRHASIDQIVEFAHTDPTRYALKIRQLLGELTSRFHEPAKATFRGKALTDALIALANETGRHLHQPCNNNDRDLFEFTTVGVELVEALHDYQPLIAPHAPLEPPSHLLLRRFRR